MSANPGLLAQRPNRLMVHLAINEADHDHDVLHWLTPVTDEEYAAARRSIDKAQEPARSSATCSPRVVREITAEELARKAGYSRPHTVPCGPDGIFLFNVGGAAAAWAT